MYTLTWDDVRPCAFVCGCNTRLAIHTTRGTIPRRLALSQRRPRRSVFPSCQRSAQSVVGCHGAREDREPLPQRDVLKGPDVFGLRQSRVPLHVEIASHSISHSGVGGEPDMANWNVPAYFTAPSAFAVVDHLSSSSSRELFLSSLRGTQAEKSKGLQNEEDNRAERSLEIRLCEALQDADAGVATSGLLVEFREPDCAVMRIAWAGVVGLLVIRDGEAIFRTHQTEGPRNALEHAYSSAGVDGYNSQGQDIHSELSGRAHDGPNKRGADEAGRGTSSSNKRDSCSYSFTSSRDSCSMSIQTAFVDLRDGDLVLAGSQSFFANLSEAQILSFVRPVSDSYDSTLAIANATCLGSFRTDDVEFVSYYLAHLAMNFVTSTNAQELLSFPFPPGSEGRPYAGDVIVCAASVSFVR